MISITIKSLGKKKVYFRDPSRKYELVELSFVDNRGTRHKAKFVLKELHDALRKLQGEATVEAVFTKADQVEIVR